MTTPPYRLRLPGPTAVPERVRQAMAQPTLSHRGPEFIAIIERHRTVIAGSRNKLSERVIRIGCMGDIRDADIATDLEHLENVLSEFHSKAATNAR